jgi:hypothetical protein
MRFGRSGFSKGDPWRPLDHKKQAMREIVRLLLVMTLNRLICGTFLAVHFHECFFDSSV